MLVPRINNRHRIASVGHYPNGTVQIDADDGTRLYFSVVHPVQQMMLREFLLEMGVEPVKLVQAEELIGLRIPVQAYLRAKQMGHGRFR